MKNFKISGRIQSGCFLAGLAATLLWTGQPARAAALEPALDNLAGPAASLRSSLGAGRQAEAQAVVARLATTRERLLVLTLVEDEGKSSAWAATEATRTLAAAPNAAARGAALAGRGALAARLGLVTRARESLDAALAENSTPPEYRTEAALWRAHLAVAERREDEAQRFWEMATIAAEKSGGPREVVSLSQKAVFEMGWETRCPAVAEKAVQTGLQYAVSLSAPEAPQRVQAQLLERAGVFAWQSGLKILAEKYWEKAEAQARLCNDPALRFWATHHNIVAALAAGTPQDIQYAAKLSASLFQLVQNSSDVRQVAYAQLLRAKMNAAIPDDTLALLRPTLARVRALPQPDPVLEAQILIDIALAWQRKGETESARAAAAAALRVSTSLPWSLRTPITREALQCGAIDNYTPVEPDAVEAASAPPPTTRTAVQADAALLPARLLSAPAGEVWNAVEAARMRAMRAALLTAGLSLKGGMTNDEIATEQSLEAEQWLLRRRQMEAERGVGNVLQSPAAAERLNTVTARLKDFRTSLSNRHPALAHARGEKPLAFSDLSRLPADTALLGYARFFENNGAVVWALICVTKNENGALNARLYRLDGTNLPGQVELWRDACSYPGQAWHGAARQAYNRLLAPAAKQIAGCKRLLICPDGVLWNVPFAALLDEAGQPLLERFTLQYAATASTGLEGMMNPQRRKPSAMVAVAAPALGGPEQFARVLGSEAGQGITGFDTNGRPIDAEGRGLIAEGRAVMAEGRGLIAEGRAVMAEGRPLDAEGRGDTLFKNDRLRSLASTHDATLSLAKMLPSGNLLSGDQATKAAIDRELKASQTAGSVTELHLATYALLLPGSPFNSALVLAESDKGRDDGLLTAREIAGWSWQGDSVLLPVVGEANMPSGQEALPALGWAFAAAGAPNLVAAGWPNSSASPQAWMEKFYAARLGGQDAVTAARQASLELRKDPQFDHPRHWARFNVVVTGF